ncbi:MAG: sulfatase [Muribaculaceae bacterium]
MKSNLIILSILPLSCGIIKAANADDRPNILWLSYEDTSPQFIGCYGNSMAKTPVMDNLAKDGVRFSNAFSTATVSSPSRFCLITGCHTARYGTGNHRSNYEIPEFVHGFPKYLRDAGYYTSNNVKTDYNHKKHREMAKESWCECSSSAWWNKREPGQPFFAVFNGIDSHQSRTMTNPWEVYQRDVLDKLDANRVTQIDAPFEMPSFYRNSPAMRKHMSRVYNSISLTDQHFGEVLAHLEADGLKESTIIFCFSDHGEGIPRGKGSSLGLGYRVPFILWIPEKYKHLTPWGKGGIVTDKLVSFEDFSATVLALAGVKIPEYIEGKSFLKNDKKYVFGACDAIDNNVELSRSVTDGRYMYTRVFTSYQPFVRWISYFDHGDIQKQMRSDFTAGLLNNEQAEILSPRVVEYLYDLKEDKWEINNLAQQSKYKKEIERFRIVLKKHLIETKDANFIPEYTLSNKQLPIPYYLRQDNKVYPVKETIETAMLCGLGKEVINEQIIKVQNNNDIVSYWAASGLFKQHHELKPHIAKLIKILPTIKYAPTKIILAATILNIVEDSTARAAMIEGITSKNNYLGVYALNALLIMDLDKAKSFVPVIQQLNESIKYQKGRGDVASMLNVTRLRLEGIEYRFDKFW